MRLASLIVALGAMFGVAAVARGAASAPAPPSEEGLWRGHGPEYVRLTGGRVDGTDGCNGVAGTYRRSGDLLTVERDLSTKMACMGVDTWLRGLSSARVAGDVMTVFGRDGSQIGVLHRAVDDRTDS